MNDIKSRKPSDRAIVLWLGGIATLLAIPAIAMQFSDEVAWGPEDFMAMGVMLVLLAIGIELVAKRLPSRRARLIGIGLALLAFLYVWAELATGVFTRLGS